MYSSYDTMRRALHLCSLPPKNPQHSSAPEKNIRHIPTEGHSAKHLTRRLKTIKVIKNKRLRNCHSEEEPQETRHLNVMWCPDESLDQEKTKEI